MDVPRDPAAERLCETYGASRGAARVADELGSAYLQLYKQVSDLGFLLDLLLCPDDLVDDSSLAIVAPRCRS